MTKMMKQLNSIVNPCDPSLSFSKRSEAAGMCIQNHLRTCAVIASIVCNFGHDPVSERTISRFSHSISVDSVDILRDKAKLLRSDDDDDGRIITTETSDRAPFYRFR